MPKVAKPYKEAGAWSLRRRIKGEDFYVCGCESQAQARAEMDKKVKAVSGRQKPWGLGPEQTTVGQALLDYGLQTLPFLKGARQECNRINRYLRAAGLSNLRVVPLDEKASEAHTEAAAEAARPKGIRRQNKAGHVYFEVVAVPPQADRKVPKGLGGHRQKLAKKSEGSDLMRERLARRDVASVCRYHVQELVDAMRKEGKSASSMQNERALLRSLLNHAFATWHWSTLADNAATRIRMPEKKPFKARVLSEQEQVHLEQALEECRNDVIEPTVVLLLETAMRTSEPIVYARWQDVNWDEHTLRLTDSKTNARDVPLSDKALAALERLKALSGGAPDEPIVSITYEALKAAWRRACQRAGITNLRLYDLRHTAATRTALRFGNVFLVQALTGHKTLAMVENYTHVSPADLVKAWQKSDAEREAAARAAMAVPTDGGTEQPHGAGHAAEHPEPALPSNVVRVDFQRVRTA